MARRVSSSDCRPATSCPAAPAIHSIAPITTSTRPMVHRIGAAQQQAEHQQDHTQDDHFRTLLVDDVEHFRSCRDRCYPPRGSETPRIIASRAERRTSRDRRRSRARSRHHLARVLRRPGVELGIPRRFRTARGSTPTSGTSSSLRASATMPCNWWPTAPRSPSGRHRARRSSTTTRRLHSRVSSVRGAATGPTSCSKRSPASTARVRTTNCTGTSAWSRPTPTTGSSSGPASSRTTSVPSTRSTCPRTSSRRTRRTSSAIAGSASNRATFPLADDGPVLTTMWRPER